MSENFIKALSVHVGTEMVYARQLHWEPGMPPGLYLGRIGGETFAVADGGWFVWYDKTPPAFTIMSDEEFRDVFVAYNDLSEEMKAICDEHPEYDDWIEIKDAEEPCKK